MKSQFTAVRLKQAPSLSATLVAKLRHEIGSKRLEVGARFPSDAEIAAAYGVSRTVVREAVSALRAEGLVSTQRGRGSIVGTLFVIPTAAEIPIVQTMMALGMGTGPAVALLMTLPSVSLPSMLMLRKDFDTRVLVTVAGLTMLVGVLCGLIGSAIL